MDSQNIRASFVNGIVELVMNTTLEKNWPFRPNLAPGTKNMVREGLIPPDKVILPPLHIKLGLVKQLIKAMKTTGSDAFQYLFQKFPKISEAKINE